MVRQLRYLVLFFVLSSCNLIGSHSSNNTNPDDDINSNDMSADFCDGKCVNATCNDGVKNGDETDLDCGGSCAPCTNGMVCGENADCDGGACTNKECKAPSCVDELKNGNESDLDCGGECLPCMTAMVCTANTDCDSAMCLDEICVASLCGDNTVNGAEECDEGGVNTATCNADCTTVICGDSIANAAANEACDDGNIITETCEYGETECSVCADDCTIQAGATRFCGDGNVDPATEVCDDGVNDGSPGSCLSDCSAAVVCGDSVVMGTEVCDDGNTTTEICTYSLTSCTVCNATCASVAGVTSYCGDVAVDIGNNEQCDDGNLIETDVCKNNCQLAARQVFVTSQTTEGNFGGLVGGDAYCQRFADAAGLSGTYMAWLSDSTGSPSTRFTQSTVPYRLVDGTLIANNWADLTDGSIAHPINLTENGGIPPDSSAVCGNVNTVWSNTTSGGTIYNVSSHCTNWTGVGGSSWGRWIETGGRWTRACNGGTCTSISNLYCFEQ